MDEIPISVTLASRNFSDFINRVRYQGTTFVLEKNGVPVARIVPVQSSSGSNYESPLQTGGSSVEENHPASKEFVEAQPGISAGENDLDRSEGRTKPARRPALNW